MSSSIRSNASTSSGCSISLAAWSPRLACCSRSMRELLLRATRLRDGLLLCTRDLLAGGEHRNPPLAGDFLAGDLQGVGVVHLRLLQGRLRLDLLGLDQCLRR